MNGNWMKLAVAAVIGLIVGVGATFGAMQVLNPAATCTMAEIDSISGEGVPVERIRRMADTCWREGRAAGNPWSLSRAFALWNRAAQMGDASAARLLAEIFDPQTREARLASDRRFREIDQALPPTDELQALAFYERAATEDPTVMARLSELRARHAAPAAPAATETAATAGEPEGRVVLRLVGSNTIGERLAPRLAEAFLAQRGATGARTVTLRPEEYRVTATLGGELVVVSISAPGSGKAFEALAQQTADVGMSSRRMKDDDVNNNAGLSDLRTSQHEHEIAFDGLAVIVNPASSVTQMDLSVLRRVFIGEVQDWRQAGGRTGSIAIYARDSESGTTKTFEELVLQRGETLTARTAERFSDSEALTNAVVQDPNGIGYIGRAYIGAARALRISSQNGRAVELTPQTVRARQYPLSRSLYLYTAPNSPPVAGEFVRFALSSEGQRVADNSGFISLR